MSELSACSLLFDCPSLDESCEECVSGEYRCKGQEGTFFKKNLVELKSKDNLWFQFYYQFKKSVLKVKKTLFFENLILTNFKENKYSKNEWYTLLWVKSVCDWGYNFTKLNFISDGIV